MSDYAKKMDKILAKLGKLDHTAASVRELRQQTGYLAQLVVLARKDSVDLHLATQRRLDDMAQILLEVKKSSQRTEERVAEILAGTRKH